jgi:hypothetical protein
MGLLAMTAFSLHPPEGPAEKVLLGLQNGKKYCIGYSDSVKTLLGKGFLWRL